MADPADPENGAFLAALQANTASPPSANAPKASIDPLLRQIQDRIKGLTRRPDIYRRRAPGSGDIAAELNVTVPDWVDLRRRRGLEMLQHFGATGGGGAAAIASGGAGGSGSGPRTDIHGLRPLGKALKTHKSKGSGRQYTSKYRGVHQTFPTRRWEAQFRRNGKPTSLGCFDHEEEAAKAYDKMMLWCELHGTGAIKGAVTNFDPSNYDMDVHWLQQVTQDELVQILRSDGRRQAAERLQRQKKEQPKDDGRNRGVGPTAGREKELAAVAAAVAGVTGSLPLAGVAGSSMMVPTSTAPSTAVSSEFTR